MNESGSLSGSIAYARLRRIDYRSGLRFAAAGIPGSVLGALRTNALYNRPDDYWERVASRYRAMTASDMDTAARARSAVSASSTVLPIPASPVTSSTRLAGGAGSTSPRSRVSPASRPMINADSSASVV